MRQNDNSSFSNVREYQRGGAELSHRRVVVLAEDECDAIAALRHEEASVPLKYCPHRRASCSPLVYGLLRRWLEHCLNWTPSRRRITGGRRQQSDRVAHRRIGLFVTHERHELDGHCISLQYIVRGLVLAAAVTAMS
jgi:hypothetical protein